MSERQNDGGPAFPRQSHTERWNESRQEYEQDSGMSLRDWFAGQALEGILSDPNVYGPDFIANSTKLAYECADAMLKAREQQ